MSGRFWLQIILVVSLAFNLAFIGMHFCMKSPLPPHGPEAFEERVTHNMTPTDAAIVHNAFAAHKAEFTEHRQKMDEAITNVRRVLQADPQNQSELKTAMDKAQSVRASSEQTMEAVMIEAAKNLSPEGREQLIPPPPPGGGR